MAFRLRLKQVAPADYANHIYDPHVSIYLVEDATLGVIDLISEPLEIERLVAWLIKNSVRISTESPPFDLQPDESIAAGYGRVIGALPEIEEITGSVEILSAAADIMVDYQMAHSLDRALGGLNLPEIYFGTTPNGTEVSCNDGGEWTWKYGPVDYDEFFLWLTEEITSGKMERQDVPRPAD